MIRKTFIAIFFNLTMAGALLLAASCSSVNEDNPLNLVDPSGKHFSGWLEEHRNYALPEGVPCMSCHGEDLNGGISGVTCVTGSLDGQDCHANGPGLHPVDWLDKSSPDFHGLAYDPSLNPCELCHGIADPEAYICLDCHFSEDGTQRVPDGSEFNHVGYGKDHWSFPLDESLVCVNCHDININLGNQTWCHNCHE